jgi:hypothetical protein
MRSDITFGSEVTRCAGWLYVPDDFGTIRGKPGIVLGQSFRVSRRCKDT